MTTNERGGDKYYWWCPECKEEKPGSKVTFSELCDDCGAGVLSLEVGQTIEEIKRQALEEGRREGELKAMESEAVRNLVDKIRDFRDSITDIPDSRPFMALGYALIAFDAYKKFLSENQAKEKGDELEAAEQLIEDHQNAVRDGLTPVETEKLRAARALVAKEKADES